MRFIAFIICCFFAGSSFAYDDDGSYEDGYFWAIDGQGNLNGPTITRACEAFKASNAYFSLQVDGTTCRACRYGNFKSNGKCPFPKYPYETFPDTRTVSKYSCLNAGYCTWGPPAISCPAADTEFTLTQSFDGELDPNTGDVVSTGEGNVLKVCGNGTCVETVQYLGCEYKYRPIHESTRVYCYPPEGDGKASCYREFVAKSTGEAGSLPSEDEDTSFFIEDEPADSSQVVDADNPPADSVVESVTIDTVETMPDGTVVEQDGVSLVGLTGAGLFISELSDVFQYVYSEGITKTENTTLTTTTSPDGSVSVVEQRDVTYNKPDEQVYTLNKDTGQVTTSTTPGYSGGTSTTTTDSYDSTGKKISSNTTTQQTGDTSGENPEQDIKCKQNPNDPSCKSPGDVTYQTSVNFSGCDEQAYACEDDAVACAAFRLKLQQECRAQADDLRQSQYMEAGLINAQETVEGTLDSAQSFIEGLDTSQMVPALDGYEGALQIADSCPPPYAINTALYSEDISFQPVCDFSTDYRPVLLTIASFIALFSFLRIATRTQLDV